MGNFKVAIGIVALIPVIALAFLNIVFCGTDVVYMSSDGKWSERQMVYRNREFKDIVSSFEKYKVMCNATDVQLERLRSKPEWIVLNTWRNLSNDVSLTIPLSSKYLETTFGFSMPKVEPPACYKNA